MNLSHRKKETEKQTGGGSQTVGGIQVNTSVRLMLVLAEGH